MTQKEKYFSFNPNDVIFKKITLFFARKQTITTVCDVWCANGFLIGKLQEVNENLEITWVDMDDELVETCKKKWIHAQQWSILDLPFEDNSYDVVIAKDVVEHVVDNYKAMSELVRVSKKYVIVSMPWPFTDAARGDFTHIRPYSQTTLKHIAYLFDLKIVEIWAAKRHFVYQILAKLLLQPIDDISVYCIYEK